MTVGYDGVVPDVSTPLLRVSGLRASVVGDSGRVPVLEGVDLDLCESEIIDVVGPSGSGKSTLLRAIARLLPGAEGELQLSGEFASSMPPQRWRTLVTLVPQKPVSVPGTVSDNLLLPWRFKSRGHAEKPGAADLARALEVLGMGDISPGRDAARLSVGQLGRLAFARVLLSSPRVLLLDEAEAALDDASAEALSRAVHLFATGGGRASAGQPGGVIRVRHRASDGLASRRLLLRNGRLQEVDR